jgi:hypothetical protein
MTNHSRCPFLRVLRARARPERRRKGGIPRAYPSADSETTNHRLTQAITNIRLDTARYNRSKSRAEFSGHALSISWPPKNRKPKSAKTSRIYTKLFEIKTLQDLSILSPLFAIRPGESPQKTPHNSNVMNTLEVNIVESRL